jgi:hypothetical protein
MITQSMASPFFKGEETPGKTLDGRTFAYWSNPWQMGSRRPQREIWSGTSGEPSAPKKMASKVFMFSSPPSGI